MTLQVTVDQGGRTLVVLLRDDPRRPIRGRHSIELAAARGGAGLHRAIDGARD